MTKVHPQVIAAQLKHTINTLECEVKLLTSCIEDFQKKLDLNRRQEASKHMMNAKFIAQRMGSMLQDVVRYTAFLHSSTKNSPGVPKGKT